MSTNKTTKKVFLFDFDGVIVDTLPVVLKVYNLLLKKYKISKQFSSKQFCNLYINNFFEGLGDVVMDKKVMNKILDERASEYIERIDDFELFIGVSDSLRLLASRGKVIIISSNWTNFINKFLLNKKIDCVSEVWGGDRNKSKVKKIIYQKKKNINAKIYYIGDTVGDIKEGKSAGVITVGVTWGFHSVELLKLEKPDYLFNKTSDLKLLV